MTESNGRIGVCSWSLRPGTPQELAELLGRLGVDSVQLALGPLTEGQWQLEQTERVLADAGITIRSGMWGTIGEDYTTLETIRTTGGLRPDEHWEANLTSAEETAQVAQRLGLDLVTFHAGFLPDEPGAEREKLMDRLRRVSEQFAGHCVRLGLETGQESAPTLLEVLDELDCSNVGVNFDPANMILYGMGDPIEALGELLPRVLQVHIKDALPSDELGEWGQEVPVGTGCVDWPRFFDLLAGANRPIDWMVEREAGESRVEDIATAIALAEDLRT